MGYEIAGVVARAGLLAAAARELPMAVPAPLRQGFALLPMTDELFDAVTDGGGGADEFDAVGLNAHQHIDDWL